MLTLTTVGAIVTAIILKKSIDKKKAAIMEKLKKDRKAKEAKEVVDDNKPEDSNSK